MIGLSHLYDMHALVCLIVMFLCCHLCVQACSGAKAPRVAAAADRAESRLARAVQVKHVLS